MIVSVNQPYFSPFPGFFQKAQRSDIFVVLDDVQFPRGTTWISRNRFKNDQGALWMTIPVWKRGLGFQRIRDVRICRKGRWPAKHFESLVHGYGHAPYFSDHLGFLENIFFQPVEKLVELNLIIIKYLLACLSLETKIVLQSELGVKSTGMDLLLDICSALDASGFLAQSPAKKYIDASRFSREKIELMVFRPASIVYPQLWGDFIPNLSVFDLVLNCGPKSRDILFA
jgi:WbqC-like protein